MVQQQQQLPKTNIGEKERARKKDQATYIQSEDSTQGKGSNCMAT
jgi:hypothetical protein